eukprot:TRINITY_DN35329_c0_g1_i1.p1 TRINITY_DN35329_c0_g1~~TRINITY_DN35329_c0_g1_i1.p1  ORF type:complete len:106 (+),score=15.89 TRINITY_DN35329_c0_g1_i1:64-381(+)
MCIRDSTYIDLNPLSQLTELPTGFLAGCTGLTVVLDLTPLIHVQTLPVDFLMGVEVTILERIVVHDGRFDVSNCRNIVLAVLSSTSETESSNGSGSRSGGEGEEE